MLLLKPCIPAPNLDLDAYVGSEVPEGSVIQIQFLGLPDTKGHS